MCLAVPGRIVRIFDHQGLRMGDVDFGGVVRRICLAYVPEAAIDDYAVVPAGFAISVVDQQQASLTLELMQRIEQESKS